MNRRGFLGTVIGAVLSNQFFAKLYTDDIQKLFGVVDDTPYRVAFNNLKTGHIIQAPPVKEIITTINSFKFYVNKLDINVPIITNKCYLIEKKSNSLIGIFKMSEMNMHPGDSLTSDITIFHDLNRIVSFESILDFWKTKCKLTGDSPIIGQHLLLGEK